MTTYPPIIGFTGRAGSGKSTAADWVLRNQNQVAKLAFARPLKRMAYELLREVLPKDHPITATDYINNPAYKEVPISFLGNYTARKVMQTLGTEWGRKAMHEDFWVAIAAGKAERVLGTSFRKSESVPIKLVFDDLRFANEAEMVRAYGGVVVRIERPDAEKPPEVSAHESEHFGFAADMTIINDGTPDDLFAKLAAIWPPTAKTSAKKA